MGSLVKYEISNRNSQIEIFLKHFFQIVMFCYCFQKLVRLSSWDYTTTQFELSPAEWAPSDGSAELRLSWTVNSQFLFLFNQNITILYLLEFRIRQDSSEWHSLSWNHGKIRRNKTKESTKSWWRKLGIWDENIDVGGKHSYRHGKDNQDSYGAASLRCLFGRNFVENNGKFVNLRYFKENCSSFQKVP